MARRNQSKPETELNFTAVFEPADEGGYVVTFPAIPDLATQGETLDEARAMAAECLHGYLESLTERGLPLPPGEIHEGEPAIREIVTVRLKTA
jgi:predicted RNase H-like HicB family nuclease